MSILSPKTNLNLKKKKNDLNLHFLNKIASFKHIFSSINELIIDQQNQYFNFDKIKNQLSEKNKHDIDQQKFIQNKIYQFRTKDQFEKNFVKKIWSEKCSICNIDEILYDDDVFVFCEGCDLMVHRLCVGLSWSHVSDIPFYCSCCESKKSSTDFLALLSNFKPIHKLSLKPMNTLLDFHSHQKCILCGRSDGLMLPVEFLKHEKCHITCAYWSNQMVINFHKSTISFSDYDYFTEVIQMSLQVSEIEDNNTYISQRVDTLFNIFNNYFNKSFSPNSLKKFKNETISLVNPNPHQQTHQNESKICQCFFESPFMTYFGHFIIEKYSKIFTQLKKKKKLTEKQNIFIKDIVKKIVEIFKCHQISELSPNDHHGDNCFNCSLENRGGCRVCFSSKGILLECHEDNCSNKVHVICAQRTGCELICPLSVYNKNDFIHALYCDVHSKTSIFRQKSILRNECTKGVSDLKEEVKLFKKYNRDKYSLTKKQISQLKKNGFNLDQIKEDSDSKYDLFDYGKDKDNRKLVWNLMRIRSNKSEEVNLGMEKDFDEKYFFNERSDQFNSGGSIEQVNEDYLSNVSSFKPLTNNKNMYEITSMKFLM